MTVYVVLWHALTPRILQGFTDESKAVAFRDEFKRLLDEFMNQIGLGANERIEIVQVPVDEPPAKFVDTIIKNCTTDV